MNIKVGERAMKSILNIGIMLLAAVVANGQGSGGDHVAVPLSDPSRPVMLTVDQVSGSIRVKAYAGKEVIVDARMNNQEAREETRDGLRRVPMTNYGLEVTEENNNVRVKTNAITKQVDLDIQVPVHTSMHVKTVNGKEVVVEGVQGEVDASNINGSVTLSGISGSAVAHALNGRLKVSFVSVDGQKPMSFSSMNGEIDLAFPASLKANVKIKNQNGDVYSDFDMKVAPSAQPTMEQSGDKGLHKVKIEHSFYATINGGGPEIQISNFNGAILIRKGGK